MEEAKKVVSDSSNIRLDAIDALFTGSAAAIQMQKKVNVILQALESEEAIEGVLRFLETAVTSYNNDGWQGVELFFQLVFPTSEGRKKFILMVERKDHGLFKKLAGRKFLD